tara:strand:+ start:621 stop:1082 length:462 start_codon:yes stop_codon:yes gene_type:complete
MTITLKPTASETTIQNNGSDIFTVDSTGIAMASGKTIAATTAVSLSTASGSAPSYSARAWVNFNGLGTVAIRASGNVSSITDIGTGRYTVNFTTAMPDGNYAVSGMSGNEGTTSVGRDLTKDGTWTTTSAPIRNTGASSTVYDNEYVTLIFIR